MPQEVVTKQVKGIFFTLISPEEIKKIARAKIVTPELYDMDGYPVDGGLMDLRLGAIDPGVRCRTCAGKLKECLGHFGYIELARPIVHIKYIGLVDTFLKCICEDCGKLLLSQEDVAKYKVKERIAKARVIKKCPYCGKKQGKVKLEKPYYFYIDNKRIFPSTIRNMLEKVSDADAAALGAVNCRPENGILTLVLVPPVTVRPSITLESGERSEDDLTHKLSDIVRANQRLWENLNAGAPEVIIEDLWDLLQYHITTFFDNNVSQVPPARHRSGQPLKTLTERIKGKEGRIRHNLAGKRVDFSSRTVVSSDPYIKIDEVGIPMEIATTLTVPEKVNDINIEKLREYIRNANSYPGANYITRPDGRKKKITEELKEEIIKEIEPGYIVERHLINRDIVLFNRHPSLHRLSLMAHYVKVLPGKTFRMNPVDTFPYNADFDGDEMNVHAPQTEEARSEAIQLLDIKNHLVTPKDGTNVLGCIEDAITGNYILTSDIKLDKDEAIQMIAESGGEIPAEAKRWPKNVDGRIVFSSFLPKVSIKTKKVTIQDGKLIKGTVDDEIIGIEKGALILELMKIYDNEEVIKVLEGIFRLGCVVLSRKGFTCGLQDIKIKIHEETDNIIKDSYKRVSEIINEYSQEKLKALPGKTLEETREIEIQQVLDGIRKKIAGLILEKINREEERNNPVNIMIFSGARGSPVNRVQMGALVGQQILWGKRIELGYKNRTLSHFARGDLMPAARGFVSSNFSSGLTPSEFFFSAITGRDSLMDTALRTPKSGYLYRRLANALQDIRVEYDGTVRDAASGIVQFVYGDDGIAVDRTHLKEKITPGEAIGIITAQSFGEPSTQMTLNVFHFAGVAEFAITLGLPRLIELFDARKEPTTPVMEIFLKSEYNNESDAEKIAAKIKEVSLKEVVSEIKINFTDMKIDMSLESKELKHHKINPEGIIEALKDKNLVIKQTKEGLSIKPKDKADYKDLYKIKAKIGDVVISGVKNIKEVLPLKRRGERDYIILTYGSNLKEVLQMKEVNSSKTRTNNIYEIASELGIEAARQLIIDETKSVIEKQGISIDEKHIKLIADLMTASGSVLGVTRTGIIKQKGSILARAAFETPIKHFVAATLSGEKDYLASVIENVIINQPVPVGTGLPGLLVKVGKKPEMAKK
ncbi:MAG: DNA-directed RNA polymerase subunit A' [Nanoarchaeota archaeon]|nr:DNA-directed RNA polymerase subunit A' [Nanoarchaeota archaeon]